MTFSGTSPTRVYAAGPVEVALGDVRKLVMEDAQSFKEWLLSQLHQHHVIFLTDQALDPESIHDFVTSLGAMRDSPFLSSVDGSPGVVRVTRSPHEAGVTPFGWGWHSDWSFLERPPRYSLLYSVVVPPSGGDTVWSNQVMAFDRLSESLKQVLRGQVGVHSARLSYGTAGTYARDIDRREMEIELSAAANASVEHPAVVTLDNDDEALYINESYTVGLAGWREWESQGLLQFLFRWQSLDDFVCRREWSPGTLAIWDNQAVIHRALDDCRGEVREFLRATFDL